MEPPLKFISSNGCIAIVPPAKVSDGVLRQPLLLEKGDASKKSFLYQWSLSSTCAAAGELRVANELCAVEIRGADEFHTGGLRGLELRAGV